MEKGKYITEFEDWGKEKKLVSICEKRKKKVYARERIEF